MSELRTELHEGKLMVTNQTGRIVLDISEAVSVAIVALRVAQMRGEIGADVYNQLDLLLAKYLARDVSQ